MVIGGAGSRLDRDDFSFCKRFVIPVAGLYLFTQIGKQRTFTAASAAMDAAAPEREFQAADSAAARAILMRDAAIIKCLFQPGAPQGLIQHVRCRRYRAHVSPLRVSLITFCSLYVSFRSKSNIFLTFWI